MCQISFHYYFGVICAFMLQCKPIFSPLFSFNIFSTEINKKHFQKLMSFMLFYYKVNESNFSSPSCFLSIFSQPKSYWIKRIFKSTIIPTMSFQKKKKRMESNLIDEFIQQTNTDEGVAHAFLQGNQSITLQACLLILILILKAGLDPNLTFEIHFNIIPTRAKLLFIRLHHSNRQENF